MYEIWKEFSFSAAHQLPGLPDGHPCRRLHGHNYKVTVAFSAYTLDEHGFVVDYNELAVIKKFIDEKLDHRYLNEIMTEPPTAENLAAYLYEIASDAICSERVQITRVEVNETDKTGAVYYGKS